MRLSRKFLWSVSTVIVLTLAAGSLAWAKLEKADTNSGITKPVTDNREYQWLQLDNGLTILVVSDPNVESAAAVMNVATGSWANPDDRPGLAHFLEHMLFLGTEKYPEADEFSEFISGNGGSQNAMTMSENTIYFFDINADQFQPALDRFAQFFTAPLFNEAYVERERNAVDAEFHTGLLDDNRRYFDALRESVNPHHPASKFAVGSLDTLKPEGLRQDLINFYQQHYSADLMSLVIYSPAPVQQSAKLARELFSLVPQHHTIDTEPKLPYFTDAQLPLQLNVKTIKQTHKLILSFPVPGPKTDLNTRAPFFISWLLNRDAKGSLSDVLKSRGLIENLGVNFADNRDDPTLLNVNIQLTQLGLKQTDEVISLVFDELQLIKDQQVKPWLYEEMQKLQELRFRFQESYRPISYAMSLSNNLKYYPETQVLSGPYRFGEFNENAIQQWLQYLKPENLALSLMTPDIKTTRKSSYYKTPYSLTKISDDRIKRWSNPSIDKDLANPEPNAFIPTDLNILPGAKSTSILYDFAPDLYIDKPGQTLWFLQSNKFNTPKVDLRARLQNTWFSANASNQIKTLLYLELVKDSLLDIADEASLAGLGYKLWQEQQGVSIRVYGYNDKLPLFVDNIINELVTLKIRPDRFEALKAELLRKFDNQKKERLLNQLYLQVYDLMDPNFLTSEEIIPELKKLTPKDLEVVREQFSGKTKLLDLIHGNMTENQAISLSNRIAANFQTVAAETNADEVIKLNSETSYLDVDSDDSDSAIMIYYQGEDSDYRDLAMFMLLNQLLQNQFFTQLRTEKQLGYAVYTRNLNFEKVPGLAFVIQSPETDPGLLQLHIEKFLNEAPQWLQKLSEDEFNKNKQGLISNLTEPDKNLLEAGTRYWHNLHYDNYNFNEQRRIAREMNAITLDGVLKFMEISILNDNAKRLVVYHIGKGHEEDYRQHRVIHAGEKIISSTEGFQKGKGTFSFADGKL
ncbi:insulinase family protein [Gynuella sp.]|uniref:insulinase family protein n=1 Tax=Gynuella sp. TaxID=2969146 RepID=UPI003D147E41